MCMCMGRGMGMHGHGHVHVHGMCIWGRVCQVYFVVMRNFLPVRAWLTFDLKGATANRRALAARFLHGVHAAADAATGGVAYGTLRDWEWLDIAMVVDVSEAAKVANPKPYPNPNPNQDGARRED